MQTLQRFIDRIGKRIYRNDNGCPCTSCKQVTEEGFIIDDLTHAHIVYDYQCDVSDELVLNYRDIK